MANIRDVAKRAGVAPITVSRFINNPGLCSPETRIRVEVAIGELGFVPNRLANALRSKRTNTLALVLTDITNPFFTTIARGVEDMPAKPAIPSSSVTRMNSASKEKMYLQILLEKRVDGILLVPALNGLDSTALIKKQISPSCTGSALPELLTDVVRCDSEGERMSSSGCSYLSDIGKLQS